MSNIIRNVVIILAVVVVILIAINYLTVPYPGVPKFIDSMTCEVFIMENDLPLGIGEYDQECLDYQSLPLIEQYEIYEQEKEQEIISEEVMEETMEEEVMEEEVMEEVMEETMEEEPVDNEVQCGPGTIPKEGVCVLDERCGPGAHYNPEINSCVHD